MRILALAPYTEEDTSSARVYNLIYQAVFRNEKETVGNDKLATRRIVKVMDALDAISEPLPGGNLRMQYEGAKLTLEDAEFDQLKRLWDSFRPTVLLIHARDVVATDDVLEKVQTVTPAELVKS